MSEHQLLAELTTAYEGLEGPEAFADRGELERYRESLLERSAAQACFLRRRLPERAEVLELACGNGRLLLALAKLGVVRDALGLDPARSRIAFAREWASDEGHSELRFEASDALTRSLEPESWSAAICITGAFAYFEPAIAGAAGGLAQKIRQALRPGGLLCLELYPHPEYVRLLDAAAGEVRLWKELSPSDPWRYYLSHLSLDAASRVLTHEKTFIHRTSGKVDSGRRERLYLYSPQEIHDLLRATGFRDVMLFDGWSETEYQGGETMVVTALR